MTTRYGFVSTYPPTQCGLATFTSALRGAMLQCAADDGPPAGPNQGADEGRVIRLVEKPLPRPGDEVVAQLVMGDPAGSYRAAELLNDCDAVILQHEYGIYGGHDGDEVLPLLDNITVPRIVVLHTVLTDPTTHQREVLEAVVAKADAVVTMTATARDRLAAIYAVDMAKVCIIAHGAPDLHTNPVMPTFRSAESTVLTWGLLGPGKGIEWGIAAMAMLRDIRPAPRYVIAGQTHPKVLLHEGEAYRDRLRAQVMAAGLQSQVSFDRHYRDAAGLASLIQSADVVLLPYDSTEQVTSGVLIEAVAAGKPVVATEFPHARELLSGGAGLLVPHRDPAAIAAALRKVLTQTGLAASMANAAAASAPHLLWPAIAQEYRALVARLVRASVAA